MRHHQQQTGGIFNMVLRIRVISLLSTVFVILLTGSCGREKVKESVPSVLPPIVEEYICSKELSRNEISTYGTISYINKADVVPKSTETIQDLYFEEGDDVQKGEVLARLDTRKLELQMEETKAGIETKKAALNLAEQRLDESRRNMEAQFHTIKNAELDLEQKRDDVVRIFSILDNKKLLFEAGGITQEELLSIELSSGEKETALKQAEYSLRIKKIGFREEDLIREGYELPENQEERKNLFMELNTRVQSAEAQLARSEWQAALTRIKTLELYMEECRIKAPISGIIARKYMDIGERAQENQPLYMIYPVDQVYALLQLSEKDLLNVKTGQEVLVLSDSDGSEHRGQIHMISPWIQKESRSGEVKVLIGNDEGVFKIGQFVRLRIELKNPIEQIMIPAESITGAEDPGVFIIRQNYLFLKKITIEEEKGRRFPVLEGLKEGDRIVRLPSELLRDGMEVRVR